MPYTYMNLPAWARAPACKLLAACGHALSPCKCIAQLPGVATARRLNATSGALGACTHAMGHFSAMRVPAAALRTRASQRPARPTLDSTRQPRISLSLEPDRETTASRPSCRFCGAYRRTPPAVCDPARWADRWPAQPRPRWHASPDRAGRCRRLS
jgi:hypothetical protein